MASKSARKPTHAPASPLPWWLALAAVALSALVVYANSLKNGFVWDDSIMLTRQLVVFDSVYHVLFPPTGIPQFSPDYYRPVVIATYLIDRTLGGGSPFPFHLTVVLAHTLVSALVYALVAQLLPRDRAGLLGATAAGILFAVHPIHTESVAWSAGRSDVLAVLFVLAALNVHAAQREKLIDQIALFAFVLLALCSKETAIVVFPLLLLLDFIAPRRERKWSPYVRAFMPAAAALFVYVPLRRVALGEFVGSVPPERVARGFVDVIGAVGFYLGRFVWPAEQSAYVDYVPTDALTMVMTLVALTAMGAAVVWWWRSDRRVPMFFTAWIFLTLAPSLTILWKIPEAPLAERYLYLPSVGFCALLGYGVSVAWNRVDMARAIVAVAVVMAALAASAATIQRNLVWKDNVALWSDAAAKSRVSGMALRSLGAEHLSAGRVAEARASLEAALARQNAPAGTQIILGNLGTIAMQSGDYESAVSYYQRALAISDQSPDMLFNLGLATLFRGKQTPAAARMALGFYEQAERVSPYDPDIQAALGQVHLILDDRSRARGHLQKALDLGLQGPSRESVQKELQRISGAA